MYSYCKEEERRATKQYRRLNALIYSQLENSDQPVKNAYDIAVPQGTAYDSTAVQPTMALLSEY